MSLATLDRTLLAAFLANREDEERFLVVLDHLEDKGVRLAELHRARHQLAGMKKKSAARDRLSKRVGELQAELDAGWLKELRAGVKECSVEAGLVEVTANTHKFCVKAFQASAPAWFRQAGLVSLRLVGAKKHVAKLAKAAALEEVAQLDLSFEGLGDREIEAVAASPALRNLFALLLRRNAFSDGGARALAASPHLARLTELDLQRNGIRDEGARALATSPYLKGLLRLDLRGNHIADEEGLRRLHPGVALGPPDEASLGNPNEQWYFIIRPEWAEGDMVMFPVVHKRTWHLTRSEEPSDTCISDEIVGEFDPEAFGEEAESSFCVMGGIPQAYAILNRLGLVDANTLYRDGVFECLLLVGGQEVNLRFVCDTPEIRAVVEPWLGVQTSFATLGELRDGLARLNEDWHVEPVDGPGGRLIAILERGVFLTLPPLPASFGGRM